MNNKKRTFITIVCSILFIMPSFLGVPLADGNLVLVPTPDSGQVNDEISTITDLNDDNIKTIITTELLVQAGLDESDLSDSGEIQGHEIRTGNGNNDNNNSSMPTEHSGYVESDQSSQSNAGAETTPIPQEQFPVENASEPVPSWPLIPDSGFGNGTDSSGLLVDPESSTTGYVNSTIVNDASLPDYVNLTAAEDPLSNMPVNAIDTDEGTSTLVEQLDPLSGTLGIVINETTLTPIPDPTGSITFTNETTDSELGGDIANGVYDDSPTLIDAGIDSLVDTSLIQGFYETVVENDDENTAFTSESTTVEGSDSSSTDSVNSIASNANSGSSGDEDDNNSNYSSSDEDHDNDGQCSDNSAHDHGHDKHKDKDKQRDGDRGNGEANDDEHHADSETTHDNDTGTSHKDSDHQNSEGSDDDRDHHDHEDERENNHDDSDHDDHDHDE